MAEKGGTCFSCFPNDDEDDDAFNAPLLIPWIIFFSNENL